jgi:Zn ribbon nucleic-acid-binding protein
MKARIACEQRLRQRTIGSVFCSPDGLFPEGDVEKQFDEVKANDKIYQALLSEEGKRERDLEKACQGLDVYTELFEPIKGAGPKIASRIIAAVINIHRFETKAKFRAFCGVHLRVHWICSDCGKKSSIESWGNNLPEIPQCIQCGSVNVVEKGVFPRRRNNEVANWSGDCRQALFLLGDQFNRRPESEWGQKLLAAKAKYRASHPEVLEVDGKKRYTDSHIHKMAIWYTLGKFAEQLFKNWHNLERKIGNSSEAKAA